MTVDTAGYPDWHGCPYVSGNGGNGRSYLSRNGHGAGWGYVDGYGSGRGAYTDGEDVSGEGDVHEWSTGDGTGQGA